MNDEGRKSQQPTTSTGDLGVGFLLGAGTVLLAGLAVLGLSWWLGVPVEIQRALLLGMVTAAAGCASWAVLLRIGRRRAMRSFLGALLGGVILRMVLYGGVVGVSVLQGAVHVNTLILALLGFHLAYQCLEVVTMSRWPRPGTAAVATGLLAIMMTTMLGVVPVNLFAAETASASMHGDAAALADDKHLPPSDAAQQHAPAAGDAHAAGDDHAEGEAGEFDLIHHVADGYMLDTPIGAIALPSEWMIGGINMAPTKHVVWMWIATVILLVMVFIARRSIGMVSHGPGNALEALVVFVRDEIARKNIGTAPDRFTPYLCSLFFFVLACNMVGLLPFGATASGNLNFTGALAVLSLFMIQAAGIRQNGLLKHIQALCPIPDGIPGWLLPIYIPIIVVVETVGIFVKPVALALRLFANMVAGHVVILSLIGIIFILQTVMVAPASVALALFIYCLEVFIGFVQAFIFTMLTALFIGLSQHPAH